MNQNLSKGIIVLGIAVRDMTRSFQNDTIWGQVRKIILYILRILYSFNIGGTLPFLCVRRLDLCLCRCTCIWCVWSVARFHRIRIFCICIWSSAIVCSNIGSVTLGFVALSTFPLGFTITLLDAPRN